MDQTNVQHHLHRDEVCLARIKERSICISLPMIISPVKKSNAQYILVNQNHRLGATKLLRLGLKGLLACVVIRGCAIILGTFLGCSRILGIFLDCSRIFGYHLFDEIYLFRNQPDFWVLIWIFN